MSVILDDGDICKWTGVWALANHAYLPSFYFRQESHTGIGCTDTEILADIETALGVLPQAIVTAAITYHGHELRRVFPLPITIPVSNITSAGPGTAAGSMCPPQDAPIGKIKAAVAGRPYQGRIYFPAPPTSFLTVVDPIQLTNIAAGHYAAILNAVLGTFAIVGAGGSCQILWGIFHRAAYPRYPVAANTLTPLVVTSIDARLGTQRRRSAFKHGGLPPF